MGEIFDLKTALIALTVLIARVDAGPGLRRGRPGCARLIPTALCWLLQRWRGGRIKDLRNGAGKLGRSWA
jgi:hypothetical protein